MWNICNINIAYKNAFTATRIDLIVNFSFLHLFKNGQFLLPYDLAFLSDFCKSNSQDNCEENQTKNIWAICPLSFKLPGEGIVGITKLTQCVIVGRTNVIDAIRFDESSSLFRVGNRVRKNQWDQLIILRSLFYVVMILKRSLMKNLEFRRSDAQIGWNKL